MVNTNRRELQPGEQAMYCYGHRSNKYLLVNYGFCFQNNGQDSMEFHLKTVFKSFEAEQIVSLNPLKKKQRDLAPVQVIRLKLDQINETMLYYLRCHMRRGLDEQWDTY